MEEEPIELVLQKAKFLKLQQFKEKTQYRFSNRYLPCFETCDPKIETVTIATGGKVSQVIIKMPDQTFTHDEKFMLTSDSSNKNFIRKVNVLAEWDSPPKPAVDLNNLSNLETFDDQQEKKKSEGSKNVRSVYSDHVKGIRRITFDESTPKEKSPVLNDLNRDDNILDISTAKDEQMLELMSQFEYIRPPTVAIGGRITALDSLKGEGNSSINEIPTDLKILNVSFSMNDPVILQDNTASVSREKSSSEAAQDSPFPLPLEELKRIESVILEGEGTQGEKNIQEILTAVASLSNSIPLDDCVAKEEMISFSNQDYSFVKSQISPRGSSSKERKSGELSPSKKVDNQRKKVKSSKPADREDMKVKIKEEIRITEDRKCEKNASSEDERNEGK